MSKFDVVLSNPPYRKGPGDWTWEEHVRKHVELLEDGSYYVLLCPASEVSICDNLEQILVSEPFDFSNQVTLDEPVHYFIWKK